MNSNGESQRMAIMKDETVTRFRRDDTSPRQTWMAPDTGAIDDALSALGRQHVSALHRLYDPILNEPVPARMLDLLRRHRGC